MTDPGWALQKAIYGVLTTDAGVLAALGGPHIYDHVPRKTALPYVSFGESTVRDYSTGDAEAHEHTVTLLVWAEARGRRQATAIRDALRRALHDVVLVLDGHRLVNLRHAFSEVRRLDDGERLTGLVRLRAVTEPL